MGRDDGEAEARRGEGTCSHSSETVRLRFELVGLKPKPLSSSELHPQAQSTAST